MIGPGIQLLHGWLSINTMNDWMDELHKKSVIKVQGEKEISVTPQNTLHIWSHIIPGRSKHHLCHLAWRRQQGAHAWSLPPWLYPWTASLRLGTFFILECKLRCRDSSIANKHTRCFLDTLKVRDTKYSITVFLIKLLSIPKDRWPNYL